MTAATVALGRRWRGFPAWGGVVVYARTMGLFLVAWELGALWVGNTVILPAPHAVAASLITLVADGSVLRNVTASLERLVVAYVVTVAVGFPVGLLMGLNQLGLELLDPVVELLRPISSIAWIPLALALLGVGFALPVFILVYVAIFPLILNTIAGVRSVDPVLLRAAQTMGIRRSTVIRQVIVPAALPSVLTGVRLSAGLGWMALIAGELIGAPSGLGWAIEFYSNAFRTSDMMAFIVVVAILGFATDVALRAVQRWLTPWATR